MSPKRIATIVGICLGAALGGCASYHSGRAEEAAEEKGEASYDLARHQAKAQYQLDEDACDSLKGDAEKACEAQAKANYEQAMADAKAKRMGAPHE